MGLDIVLNEISFINAANDIPTAKKLMSELFETITAITGIVGRGNSKLEVCTPKNFKFLPLAPEYPMARWMNDKSVNDLQRALLITIAANRPFIDDVNDTYEDEFLYQGKSVKSLGYTFLKNGLAVSMKSDPCWDLSSLELEHRHLDSTCELTIDQVEVVHGSCKMHILQHAPWIKSSLQAEAYNSITNNASLWERRKELFPHLQFCSDVESQLQAVPNSGMLHAILKRLLALEEFCKEWRTGPFDRNKTGYKVIPESEATLNQYRRTRLFVCPDGVTRLFEWHTRLSEGWRIHFCYLEEDRQLIIGYIGCHLPIASSR